MSETDVKPATVRTLIVGFSQASQSAVQALLRRGQPPTSILVVAARAEQADAAARLGVRAQLAPIPEGVEGHLQPAIARVIVDVEDDACAEGLVRHIRARTPGALVLVRAADKGSVARLLASGATEAFCEARIAGKLLAETAVPRMSPDSLH